MPGRASASALSDECPAAIDEIIARESIALVALLFSALPRRGFFSLARSAACFSVPACFSSGGPSSSSLPEAASFSVPVRFCPWLALLTRCRRFWNQIWTERVGMSSSAASACRNIRRGQ